MSTSVDTAKESKTCPFCKFPFPNAQPVKHPFKGYRVECGSCGSCGPVQRTIESAIGAWNVRLHPLPNKDDLFDVIESFNEDVCPIHGASQDGILDSHYYDLSEALCEFITKKIEESVL